MTESATPSMASSFRWTEPGVASHVREDSYVQGCDRDTWVASAPARSTPRISKLKPSQRDSHRELTHMIFFDGTASSSRGYEGPTSVSPRISA